LIGGEVVALDKLLCERGLQPLKGRHVSLAYGANRNPGTLAIKMRDYRYASSRGLVLPVLHGSTSGSDVVACSLSGQGYLYADLLPEEGDSDSTHIEAWFPLLDADQLRVMHDGEQVREGLYTVARYRSRLDGLSIPIEALGYAGNDPVFVSPDLDSAIAYASVLVAHRSLPAMNAVEIVDHVLMVGRIRARVQAVSQVATTHQLMAFMNNRWWINFRGERQPDGRYDEILGMLSAVIQAHQRPSSSSSIMAGRGLAMSVDDAYDPGPERSLGAQIAQSSVSG
jgi:hypothetical protein